MSCRVSSVALLIVCLAGLAGGQVTADFTADPVVGQAPLTVQFTDLSQGPILHWSWLFGDGGSSLAQNPGHVYEQPGTYSVQLFVIGGGGSGLESKQNYITVLPFEGELAFSATPVAGAAPLRVAFENQSNTTPAPDAWSWDFGDGTTSTAKAPTHTYAAPGTYDVTLTAAFGSYEETLEKNELIQVSLFDGDLAFTLAPEAGMAPLAVTFSDQSSTSPPIESWSWDFGDGTGGSGPSPAHTYLQPGTYDVAMTAFAGEYGDTVVVHDAVVVDPGPINVGFDYSPTFGSAPLTVEFEEQTTGGAVAWSWDFGDGSTSRLPDPEHVYQQIGVYTVSLTATGALGDEQSVVVRDAVVVQPSSTYYVDASHPTCPGVGTLDDPFCALEDAVAAAAPGDTVQLAPGWYVLPGAPSWPGILVDKQLTIRGGSEDWAATTLEGRVSVDLDVDGAVIERLTFDGTVFNYGGLLLRRCLVNGSIRNQPSNDFDYSDPPYTARLEMLDCVVDGSIVNQVYNLGGASGEGNDAALIMTNCSVSYDGGPFGAAAAVSNWLYTSAGLGTASGGHGVETTLVNCSVAAKAGGLGAGVLSRYYSDYQGSPNEGLELTLINTTVAGFEVGLQVLPWSSLPLTGVDFTTTIGNSIIAGNTADIEVASMWAGPVASQGHNLIGSNVEPGTFLATPSDLIDADPQFIDLAAGNLRLSPGSPAIDAGAIALLPADVYDLDCDGDTDEPPPLDLDGNDRRFDDPATPDSGEGAAPIVDIGAYEFGASLPTQQWTDLGHALAGINGEPSLSGSGALCAGAETELRLQGALPNTFVSLVAGWSQIDMPLHGGVLVPSPDVRFEFATGGAGGFTLAAAWPPGVPPGAELFFQVWLADPAGAEGYAASNAVRGVTP